MLLAAVLACAAPVAHGESDDLRVEVVGLDGQTRTGRLVQLTPEVVLRTDAGQVGLAWSDVLSLRPVDVSTTQPAALTDAPLRFSLADGSAFGGEVIDGSGTQFTVRLAATSTTCTLELNLLSAIEVAAASPAAREQLRTLPGQSQPPVAGADRAPPELGDVAVVARGGETAVLRGRVRRIDQTGVGFDWNGRELTLPWARVGGIIFAQPAPRTAPCAVRLHNAEVFTGRVLGGSQQTLVLRCGGWADLELPWAMIQRVDCRSERLVFLSDLKPARYDFTPFFDKKWDYAVDQTLSGQPIRLGGQEYARGVTMHSRAALTYEIDRRFGQFAAAAGIVDEMGPRGCVRMAVVADGRTLWEAKGVRGGRPPREVVVDVSGVQELTLFVDFDEELDLSDHAVWAFARLIR